MHKSSLRKLNWSNAQKFLENLFLDNRIWHQIIEEKYSKIMLISVFSCFIEMTLMKASWVRLWGILRKKVIWEYYAIWSNGTCKIWSINIILQIWIWEVLFMIIKNQHAKNANIYIHSVLWQQSIYIPCKLYQNIGPMIRNNVKIDSSYHIPVFLSGFLIIEILKFSTELIISLQMMLNIYFELQ